LQDVVGPAELFHFLAQLDELVVLGGRRPLPPSGVDLGLLHPEAQRLGADAELVGDADTTP
jgi:hypothetical protein